MNQNTPPQILDGRTRVLFPAWRTMARAAFLLLLAAAASIPARAATFTWDASTTGTGSDGGGIWSNGGASNWASGGSDSPWSNSDNTDNAVFGVGGTPGTVTVSGGVNVGNITFNPVASGTYYTIAGSTITLTSGTITTSAASATITSALAGSVGLTVTGAGTLTLNGNDTYSGGTTISSGALFLGNGSALGSGTLTLSGGSLVSTSGITVSNNVAVTAAKTTTLTGGVGAGDMLFTGSVVGSGTLQTSNAGDNIRFQGDDSGFTGTFIQQSGNGAVYLNSASSASAGAVWKINSTTFLAAAGTYNFGSLTGSGQIDATSGTDVISVGALNQSGTFSGVIANAGGTGSLIKVGTGTLTLSNASSYSGGTTLSSGTLTPTVAGALGSGTLTLSGGSLVNLSGVTLPNNVVVTPSTTTTLLGGGGGGYLALSGSLTGSGTITLPNNGGNIRFLGNDSGFSGTCIVQSGCSLFLGNNSPTTGGGISASASAAWQENGTVYLNNSTVSDTYNFGLLSGAGTITQNSQTALLSVGALNQSGTFSGVIQGSGVSLTVVGTGTTTLTGANTYSGITTVNAGATLQVGNGVATGSVSSSGTIADNGTLTYDSPSGGLTVSTNIAGNGVFNVNGPGISNDGAYTFSGASNTFSGAINVNNARLLVASTTFTSATSINVTSGGQVFVAAGTSGTISTPLTIAGSGWPSSSGPLGALRLDGGTWGGAITVSGSATIESYSGSGTINGNIGVGGNVLTLLATNGGNITINGNLTSTSAGSVSNAGSNLSLFLDGDNSGLLGSYTNTGGNLFFAAPTAGSANAAWVINAGNLYNNIPTATNATPTISLGALSGAGGQLGDNVGGSVVTYSIGALGTSTTYSGVIINNSGVTAITKVGSGTLTLAGANTYTGATSVTSGTLAVSNIAAYASGTTTISSGATFAVNPASTQNAASSPIFTGSGTLLMNGPGLWDLEGTVLIKMNAGGLVDIEGGTIQDNGNTKPSWTSNFGSVNVASGATLDLYADNGQMDALTGGGTVQNSYSGGGGGLRTITVGVSNGSGAFSGVIAGAGGGLNLTKAGTGTEILTGANTYGGATNVNAGTLIVSGSISGTSVVNIATGATLEADGLVNTGAIVSATGGTIQGVGRLGAVNLAGGATLAPGFETSGPVASGSLSAGNVVFTDTGSAFSIALGVTSGSDSTVLASSGSVTLDKTPLQLTLGSAINNPANINLVYVIINGGASGTGSGADLFTYGGNTVANGASFTTAGGFTFEVLYAENAAGTGSGSDVDLQLTAIPEPGTWASILCGLGLLCAYQRRRQVRLK